MLLAMLLRTIGADRIADAGHAMIWPERTNI
jgi:hypothetical protein